ncbi:MAG: hypothetical protein LBQ44_04380, partial [Treponema sp.]|nr:hypothetical protein [Treponema sp.]
PLQRAELDETLRNRWFRDISELFHDRRWDGLTGGEGEVRELFSFFLPPQGSFALPPGSLSEGADWAVIPGPDPQSRGGAWLALHTDPGGGKKAARIRKVLEDLTR